MTGISVALPLVVAAVLSAALIPLILRVSHKRGWYDHYDDRKVHDGDIPRLAGVGIFLATIGGFFVGLVFAGNGNGPVVNLAMVGVLAGLALVHVTGVVDDFRNVRAWQKLLFQILSALLVVLGGTMIRGIGLPWVGATVSVGWAIGAPLTVLWLIGVSNAVNLMDGIDGLAGGLSLIATVGFGAAHASAGNWIGVIASLALAGALLGFLLFNFPPAKIFMGDGGSLFLGFALAALPFLGPAESIDSGMFFVAITILFVPILDVFAAILRRIRHRRPIHAPDMEHVHHKLMALGLSARQIDAVIYVVSAGLAVAAVGGYNLRDWRGGAILAAVWVAGVGAFSVLHFVRRVQRRREVSS